MYTDAIAAAAEAAPVVTPDAPKVEGLELHIDGDYLAYYASGNDECSAGQARQNALNVIDKFKDVSGATKVVMHNTSNNSHKGERYLIATVKPYQEHRVAGRKPKNHGYLQNWLQSYEGELFFVKNWANREADDGIAVCSHYAIKRDPGYIVIATADKDMRMLPGLHVDWKTKELVRVNPGDFDVKGTTENTKGEVKQYGLLFFLQQMLMGDTADNIPGLPQYLATTAKKEDVFKKLGPKTAVQMLGGLTLAEAVEKVEMHYFLNYHRDCCSLVQRGLSDVHRVR